MRSRICGFIYTHVRNHGVQSPENYLDLTVRIYNAWESGDLTNLSYPSYIHHQCKGDVN